MTWWPETLHAMLDELALALVLDGTSDRARMAETSAAERVVPLPQMAEALRAWCSGARAGAARAAA